MVLEHQKQMGDPPQDYVMFWCEPCDTHHQIPVTGPRAWGWNGSVESPTITPSIRVSYDFEDGKPTKCCHSNVTDGQILYHGDSTHALAGQTVPLAEMP